MQMDSTDDSESGSFSSADSENEISIPDVKELLNPHLVDILQLPVVGRLCDPALRPPPGVQEDDLSDQMGGISQAVPVFNPFFFKTIFRLLKGVCVSCQRLDMMQVEGEFFMQQMRLLERGYVVAARELGKYFRSRSLLGFTAKELVTKAEELMQDAAGNAPSSSKMVEAAMSQLLEDMLHRRFSHRCQHCLSLTANISRYYLRAVSKGSISSSSAMPEMLEPTAKKARLADDLCGPKEKSMDTKIPVTCNKTLEYAGSLKSKIPVTCKRTLEYAGSLKAKSPLTCNRTLEYAGSLETTISVTCNRTLEYAGCLEAKSPLTSKRTLDNAEKRVLHPSNLTGLKANVGKKKSAIPTYLLDHNYCHLDSMVVASGVRTGEPAGPTHHPSSDNTTVHLQPVKLCRTKSSKGKYVRDPVLREKHRIAEKQRRAMHCLLFEKLAATAIRVRARAPLSVKKNITLPRKSKKNILIVALRLLEYLHFQINKKYDSLMHKLRDTFALLSERVRESPCNPRVQQDLNVVMEMMSEVQRLSFKSV